MIKVIGQRSNHFWFLDKFLFYKAILYCLQWHWGLVGKKQWTEVKLIYLLKRIDFFSVPIYNVHIWLHNIIIYILCFFNNNTILSSLYKSSKALFFISLWHWIVQVLSETFIVELEVLTLHQESLQCSLYTHFLRDKIKIKLRLFS